MRQKGFGIIIYSCITVLLIVSGCSSGQAASPSPKALNQSTSASQATEQPKVIATASSSSSANAVKVLSAAVKPPAGMDLVTQNDSLALFMNKQNTEIAIEDKASGKVFYSNPPDRDSDAVASGFQKGMLGGQLFLTYLDSTSNYHNFDNYNDSIKKKQFKVENLKNGVKITYTIGDTAKGKSALPQFISKDRMQKLIFDKVDKESQHYILRHYLPDSKNPNIYKRFDDSLNTFALNKTLDIFNKAGYTAKDLAKDNQLNHVKGGAGNGKAVFTVPLEYQLEGNQLVATVPVKEIKETDGFQITNIDLLDYFGAAGTKAKGYELVPDGSGGLIDLNNGKTYGDAFSEQVYKRDQTIVPDKEPSPNNGAELPVFGIKSNDQAIIGIISQGDAIASVNADVSGRTNSYNFTYAGFQVRYHQQMALHGAGNTAVNEITQQDEYAGDLQVRYGFLSGDQANYSGMAQYYRNYLQQKYKLSALKPNQHVPFYLDLVGAIQKRATILGIPYKKMLPLTTFKNAEQIVSEMKQGGINNIQLRYLGWFDHGVSQTVANHISPDGELGGTSGFNSMNQFMNKQGVTVYPDVSFNRVYRGSWGFNARTEASRTILRRLGQFYDYNVADQSLGSDMPLLRQHYVLSPNVLPDIVKDYLDAYKKYKLNNISLRYFGDVLNSDYNTKKQIGRQKAESIYDQQLSDIQKESSNIMVTSGNAYTLPYAKQIVNMPLSDTHYIIEDQSVPFYQMVVHGLINYSGDPINLAPNQDMQFHLLKDLEFGAYPHFEWFYQGSDQVLLTKYDSIYSGNYKSWLGDAESMYKKVDKVYANIQNQSMISHVQLQNGVFKTTYANGAYVIVNYNSDPVTVDGQTIGAKNFAAGGGA